MLKIRLTPLLKTPARNHCKQNRAKALPGHFWRAQKPVVFPRIARRRVFSQLRGRMAFDSFRDFIAALDRAGELKRISQPVAAGLKEGKPVVADLLPK
jgi:hypothetical protein